MICRLGDNWRGWISQEGLREGLGFRDPHIKLVGMLWLLVSIKRWVRIRGYV